MTTNEGDIASNDVELADHETRITDLEDADVIATINTDIDFTASDSEDETISITNSTVELIRGRLYIDTDPGAALDAYATISFYNKAATKGEDLFYRTVAKIVYTELEVATSVGSPNITMDDETDLSPNDLILVLGGTEEYARLKTIADTCVAEDNFANAHAVDTGVTRVIEFSGFPLWNYESGTNVYLNISFSAVQTVSLKLEMVIRRLDL